MSETTVDSATPGPESLEQAKEEKALKKTFGEIREEARMEVLSGVDREKYEKLEPDEQEFVNQVCLYEEKSQKVGRTHHKIKLREIMLCRDVAQAYCPGKDAVGQYSEAKRIIQNSETGSDSVKFVLSRKVCSMLDKIFNIYQSNPSSYVRADLHKAETDLLNYIGRLGRMIREPLNEAKRIYYKLKERAGWSLPAAAFGMAEDCDVPQLFFNRYSSPAQLLLKDPEKPFRSDNNNPPLRLDYRIKNAVLIVAGENQFHLDKGRFDKVRDTAAAKFIMAKSIKEGKDKIAQAYKRDTYKLAEKFILEDDLTVESIKEEAFSFFYYYTLKNLPSTASRADAAELFFNEFMKAEEDIGCRGFSRYIYPPEAIEDPNEPVAWTKAGTRAYKLRKMFNNVAAGKIRLSMFPTRMNELVSEYLEEQFEALKKQIGEPFAQKIKKAETELEKFVKTHGSPLEQEQKDLEAIAKLEAEYKKSIDEAFSLIVKTLHKNLKADTSEKKKELLGLVKPKLIGEIEKKTQVLDDLRKKYEELIKRKNKLETQYAKAVELSKRLKDDSLDKEALEQEKQLIVSLAGQSGPEAVSPEAMVGRISERRKMVKSNLENIKNHFDHGVALKKTLKKLIALIEEADSRAGEISTLRKKQEENNQLRQEEQRLNDALKQVTHEYEEQVGRIDEAIEVNRES